MRLCVAHGCLLRAPTVKPSREYASPAASRSCTACTIWSRPRAILAFYSSWPGLSRPSTSSFWVVQQSKTWMAGTRPGMTGRGGRCGLFYARKARRLEELVRERHPQRAVLLGLGALLDPLRIRRERRPLLLAIGHRLVGDQIDQVVVRLPDLGGPEAGLLDAVLVEALQQVRHAARHRAIAAHLVDHGSSRCM